MINKLEIEIWEIKIIIIKKNSRRLKWPVHIAYEHTGNKLFFQKSHLTAQRCMSRPAGKQKYMAAVSREIDETCNAVQLNGFFGKTIYFYKSFLFKVQRYLCVYLFL